MELDQNVLGIRELELSTQRWGFPRASDLVAAYISRVSQECEHVLGVFLKINNYCMWERNPLSILFEVYLCENKTMHEVV
jgi:hypothetical protein